MWSDYFYTILMPEPTLYLVSQKASSCPGRWWSPTQDPVTQVSTYFTTVLSGPQRKRESQGERPPGVISTRSSISFPAG